MESGGSFDKIIGLLDGFCNLAQKKVGKKVGNKVGPRQQKGGTNMKTKSLGILTVSFLVAMILTGCGGFKVKNTEGLYLAYKDIDRASSYASELTAMKDIPKKNFFDAKDKYTQATNVLNGYLMKAITDAADYEVNNTKEEYLATGGTAKVDAFEKEVRLLRPMKQKGAAAVAAIIPIVVPVAEAAMKAITEADQKAKDKGLDVFTKSVEKYKMKPFEEIPEGKVVKEGGK
jgi:hypothetical protein